MIFLFERLYRYDNATISKKHSSVIPYRYCKVKQRFSPEIVEKQVDSLFVSYLRLTWVLRMLYNKIGKHAIKNTIPIKSNFFLN